MVKKHIDIIVRFKQNLKGFADGMAMPLKKFKGLETEGAN